MEKHQIEAAKLLAQGKTQEQAAAAAGVTRRTISRWLRIPDFAQIVRTGSEVGKAEALEEAIEVVTAAVAQEEQISIEQLWTAALKTVRDILENSESRNLDKLRAAELVARWIELDGHFRRLREEEADKRSQPQQSGLSDSTANEIRRKILGLPPANNPNNN
jgi:transcriptional regulator with XRE-family HTH domain